jgi:secreted PhoX family phosphatase
VATNPPTDPANPRPANAYGQIIKWFYRKDFTEPTFGWDIFVRDARRASSSPKTMGRDRQLGPIPL